VSVGVREDEIRLEVADLFHCRDCPFQFSESGIVGLTSAFLFAGSRSVVASLRNVGDESTSLFME
jgi:CHAT domain-containing protein